jgi:hypothetical protein
MDGDGWWTDSSLAKRIYLLHGYHNHGTKQSRWMGGWDRPFVGLESTSLHVGVNHRCTRTEQMDGDDGGGPTVRWPRNLPTAWVP